MDNTEKKEINVYLLVIIEPITNTSNFTLQTISSNWIAECDETSEDFKPDQRSLVPHKVKAQYVHFRSHAKYFLLPWKILEQIST